jgi:KipI family sensor histidine kinase inhibitor
VTGQEAASPLVLRSCGDTAWLLDLHDNASVHLWAAAIREAGFDGVTEVIPGLVSLLVSIDPNVTSLGRLRSGILDLRPSAAEVSQPRHHVIDVIYDGEDLAAVADLTGLTIREVVQAHTGTPWTVAFCGFAPGFAYLVGGDSRLQIPRRDEARVRVPAGSVAIAGAFSAVYPRVSPGGWQLLGRTEATLWDVGAESPSILSPGDAVTFRDSEAI